MSPLTLSCRTLPGGVLITVRGELDSTNAHQLESCAERHLEPGADMVLDLDGLTFMDSSGLHLLLRVDAAVRERGGLLRLAAVQAIPERVLRLTGVWQALDIHPDARQAIAAMRDHHADDAR